MPSPSISVVVNGQAKEVPPDRSVAQLLEWFQLPPDRVAVELNESIVRKRDWPQTIVTGGSRIEIVEFVGGG